MYFNKKIKIILLITILITLLTGCGNKDEIESDSKTNNQIKSDSKANNYTFNGFEVISVEKVGFEYQYIVYDKETKVEYFIINQGDKICMNERYNSDKTLKIYNQDTNK